MIKKMLFTAGLLGVILSHQPLSSHCQMPCGIYHDDMVYEQVDQYIETMYKAVTMLNESKFSNAKERTEFVRWACLKDDESDEMAQVFLTYFLQQKVKPDEKDTVNKLVGIHKMLFLLMRIKQNVDVDLVNQFGKEWLSLKSLFHAPEYECKMEMIRLKAYGATGATGAAGAAHSHDHDHDHDHDDDGHTH